jgi:hypothetical protein
MASQTAKNFRLEFITQLRMQTNFNLKGGRPSENKDVTLSKYSALHDEQSCNKPWKHTIQAVSGE